jgi:hypothetical protein
VAHQLWETVEHGPEFLHPTQHFVLLVTHRSALSGC